MPYPTVCPTFCPTKVEIFTRSVRHYATQIDDPKICLTASNFILLDQTAYEFSSYNAVGYCLGIPVASLDIVAKFVSSSLKKVMIVRKSNRRIL